MGALGKSIQVVAVVLILGIPVSVSLTQVITASGTAGAGFAGALQNDLQSISVITPGYSNGNYAYLNGSNTSSAHSNTLGCAPHAPFLLLTLTPSTNFGLPALRVTFTAETQCGVSPYTVHWVFGDGNTSTQSTVNLTLLAGLYQEFIYNHTYNYVGSFVAYFSVTDGNHTLVGTSTSIYVSFTPGLFYSFYNESGLIGRGITGTTYAIGLAETCGLASNYNSTLTTDLTKFDTHFGLASPTVNFVKPNSTLCKVSGNPWQEETDLDIQWAHVAAPGATIYVCESSFATVQGVSACDQYFYTVRSTDDTMIVSNSWGTCAVGNALSATGVVECDNAVDPYASIWSTAESAGMNLLASTGDWTPNSCISTNYPSSNPYGIAVGGTTVTNVGPSGTYGAESAWINRSAVGTECYAHRNGGYIGVNGELGEDYGTNSYYSAPSWQVNVSTTYRYVPDVSLVANESTGVPIVFNGHWYVVGGTSVGSPTWAGILDILFSASAPHLSGFAASFLYSHPNCFQGITNPVGGVDGLGTPNIGCLAGA
jgi:subtilase family serine protease